MTLILALNQFGQDIRFLPAVIKSSNFITIYRGETKTTIP